ncbi:hypothetical protein L1049_016303 [Liquidambar formosana]|uniref:F-box domain-containing protein n=1 Tax=Liquidambar formosana TaxID=63359 RepID=A0AAP0X314_LIQFO
MESVSKNQIEGAMPMPTLPHDIIVDILLRLPVKSLLRFKCVCELWDCLISSTQFVKMHLNQATRDVNNKRQRCLVSIDPPQSVDFEADGDDDDATVMFDNLLGIYPKHERMFVGSANGLVCLVIDVFYIILWNPSTREVNLLPKPKYLKKLPKPGKELDGFYGLCLDDLDLNFGLGYDSSIDDYKVLRLIPPFSRRFVKTKAEIFTLKTNSWRKIRNIHPSACLFNGAGTFSNGSLHWLVNHVTDEDQLKSTIISFDLATEKFQEVVPLPDHDDSSSKDFRVLGGCLSVLYQCANSFEVWVMKEYGVKTSWTKLVTIPCEKAPPSPGILDDDRFFLLYDDSLQPLCFSKNDKVLMTVSRFDLVMVMYDLKKDTFRRLPTYAHNDPVIYVESLISPNSNDGTARQRRRQWKRQKMNREERYFMNPQSGWEL